MSHISFGGLALVAVVGFGVPLLLGFLPRVKIPSVVMEIFAGILIGPSVLGWVEVDTPIQVLSLLGLASLLFLAGLEIEVDRLGGRALELAVIGFVMSLGLALALAYGLQAFGLIQAPRFVAIVLAATGLGVIVPILKDAGETSTPFGQLVVAAASISDFGTVVLLSLFFSRTASSVATQLLLLGGFVVTAAMLVMVGVRGARWNRLSDVLVRLQDTTAQIRVRGAALLLVSLVAVAERFGLETILAAFIAGVILTLVDRDAALSHPQFRMKLEAIGFGLFVPVFFVSSGIKFNLAALVASPSSLLQVPIYLLALLAVRGLPAWLYRPLLGVRRSIAAGLFQATSLSFIVASVQIGVELRVLTEATGAALVTAALLSVLVFPLAAGFVLRGEPAALMAPAKC